jgi:hypothetical protein
MKGGVMGKKFLIPREEQAVHLPMLQPDCKPILLEENTHA